MWLASATGNPIVPFHIEARRFWTVNSWDAHQVPKPGSDVAVAIGEPIEVPADADEAAIERARDELERALVALEHRAKGLLEGPTHGEPEGDEGP